MASIMLGFLPLNHLMGRMSVLQCLSAGGTMTFVRPSPVCCDTLAAPLFSATSALHLPHVLGSAGFPGGLC